MSTVIKLTNSKYWYSKFMYQGVVYQKSTRTTNKKLAQQISTQYFEEVITKKNIIGEKNISVLDAFKSYSKTRPKDLNTQKLSQFISKWIIQTKIINNDTPISLVTTSVLEQIVEVRRSEGKKESTIKQHLGFVIRAVKWAKKNGYSTSSFEPPKISFKNGRLRYLSEEEEKRLLIELDPNRMIKQYPEKCTHHRYFQDNYDLTVLLLDTGARLSEITTLKWKNIDLKKGTISLYRSKVGNESIIHMTSRVQAILKRRFANKINDFLFNNSNDGYKKGVAGIKAAFKRTGLEDMTIHGLRHTCASRLIQNGMSLYDVSHILGHSNIAMTERYAHIAKSDVSKKARDVLNKTKQSDYFPAPELYNTYTNSSAGSPFDNIDLGVKTNLNFTLSN